MPPLLSPQYMGMIRTSKSAITRLFIRHLYNSGNYPKARKYANKNVHCEINSSFSQSIILRSLWNEEKWKEVIKFVSEYPHSDIEDFSNRAQIKLEIQSDDNILTPDKYSHCGWNANSPLDNWYQEHNILWLRHPWGWTHWLMPEGYSLLQTHPSLLSLALNVLLRPWVKEVRNIETLRRPYGCNIALSYSGGIDSTAAALLMPKDTILGYHERNFPSMLNQGLAKNLFAVWKKRHDRDVLCVSSNHEKIRTFHEKPAGFSTDYASGVHLILLADFLDLNSLAFGTPIDNTWLNKGKIFRDFQTSKQWTEWVEYFSHAGLHLELPINHISEAGTLRICQKSDLIDSINSCLRGKESTGCGRCWKCFLKNGPLGRQVNPQSKEIQTFLHTAPLRTGQQALWAIQVQGFEHLAPHLNEHFQQSFEWWEKAYRPGINLIGDSLRSSIETKTQQLLGFMDSPEPLQRVNIYSETHD